MKNGMATADKERNEVMFIKGSEENCGFIILSIILIIKILFFYWSHKRQNTEASLNKEEEGHRGKL